MEAIILIFVIVIIFFSILNLIATRYKRCPSNKVLVIYGKTSGGRSAKTIHGGGAFVWPLIQAYTYLSLEPLAIEVDLKSTLSKNNIRVSVPSTFTVGISVRQELLQNAAERLLGLPSSSVISSAEDIIIGQLRSVIATMTIEEINKDRETFLTSINENVNEELNKIGLDVINVNIRDITDESGYIEAIGKKAAAEAIQQAKVDVAEQEKLGASGEAKANRERLITVAKEESQAAQGTKEAERDQNIRLAQLSAEVIEGENTSQAQIARYNATLAQAQAESLKLGQVAVAAAKRAVLEAQTQTEIARLEKEELAQIEINKRRIVIEASAEAQRLSEIARGEADAIRQKYIAEAEGIRQTLTAKADGYRMLVESAGNAQAVANLLLIEKMEEIVRTQADALANINIDKITVWDSGNGDNGGGGVKSFVRDFSTSLPPLHEIAKQAGIDLPQFLGGVQNTADTVVTVEKENEPILSDSSK
ncbi:flotillin [Erysipelotrichaceae bacterium]|nr:flotillin [Erysipelotrichaceae bacterium]